MRKRILTMLMAIAMVVTLLPVTALAATNYDVSIGGISFTSENTIIDSSDSISSATIKSGTAELTVEGDTYTLTLNNFTMESDGYGVWADQDALVVKLVGKNRIVTGYTGILNRSGSLTIDSDEGGSLEVIARDYADIMGLFGSTVFIKNCEVTLDVGLKSGYTDACDVPIRCGSLWIDNAKVTMVKESKSSASGEGFVVGATEVKVGDVLISSGEISSSVKIGGTAIIDCGEQTITLPGGGGINGGSVTIPEETSFVIIPFGAIDEVEKDHEGNVTLPSGTVVEQTDGTKVTLPDGGSLDVNGGVASNGTVTVTDKKGNETTVTPPSGESVIVGADGTVDAPEGSVVKKKPANKPSYSGSYTPPSVSATVDNSSLSNAAKAVGSAIANGTAEYQPVAGYTKADIVKLQKDSKLNLAIEKKVGYDADDKALIDKEIEKAGGVASGTSVVYYDIIPMLNSDSGITVATVTDTEKELTITIDLSYDLQQAAKAGKKICVIRAHEGVATFLDCKLNAEKTKVTFSSSDFSTYAVVALDKDGNVMSPQTFDSGVALYVGMSILAATGSAVVIDKKKK